MDKLEIVCWPEIHPRQNKEKWMWEALNSVNRRQ